MQEQKNETVKLNNLREENLKEEYEKKIGKLFINLPIKTKSVEEKCLKQAFYKQQRNHTGGSEMKQQHDGMAR